MAYADHTFKDKNPIKGWLQQQRLVTALRLIETNQIGANRVLDFGAGDAELCKQFIQKKSASKIFCYEPTPSLLEEARNNLSGVDPQRCVLLPELAQELNGSMDVVYCLEVFEHLPASETRAAIEAIENLLVPKGHLIVGVPVEVGLPALYKGLFRLTRRYGHFDATPANIFRAAIGRPPLERPIGEIAPGFNFHFEHLGFDWKNLRELFLEKFDLVDCVNSPLNLGSWCMPEVYFVLQKK